MKPAALAAVPPAQPSEDFLDSGCMTSAQLMTEYQISRPTLDRLVAEGLPALNVGCGKKRSLRFNRAAVAAWLRNRP